MESRYEVIEDHPPRTSSDNSSSDDALLEKKTGAVITERTQRRSFWRRHACSICAHVSIFIIYSTLAQVLIALNPLWQRLLAHETQPRQPYLHSPANGIIEWQLQKFNSGDGHTGPYSGYPRPELEAAWEGLLGKMNVRLSYNDLKAFNRQEQAVALADNSGYAGTLNVYHEIHCVRWMHKYMYQEFYWQPLSDEQREENRLHSEHCLNMLRKSAMCHGDVGIVTYQWKGDNTKPSASATAHKCINWDRLVEWTNARTVDMFAPGAIIHPDTGDSRKVTTIPDLPE